MDQCGGHSRHAADRVEKPEEEEMLRKKLDGFKILLIAEFLFLLVLLSGCFQEEKEVLCFTGEEISQAVVYEEDSAVYESERIVLTPGVYLVRVQSELADDRSMYVEVKCDSSYFKALRSNGIMIVPGKDELEYEVYVTARVREAYVECVLYGADTQELVQLTVCSTGLGNRMFIFIMLLLFSVLDFMICFRKKILEGKVSVKQQVVFWTMAAGLLVAYFPYLTDYFFFGEETVVYLQKIEQLKENGLSGSDWWLILPAALRMLGFSIMTAYKFFVFVVQAASLLLAYYVLKKCVRDEYAALAGSMIYLLLPHRILEVYNRGALGSFPGHLTAAVLALGAAFLYRKVKNSRKMLPKIAAGVMAVVIAGSAIYYVNKIVFEAVPVYLYNIENIGTAGLDESE